ncbi:MAG: hypothetical protein JJE45_00285 [Prolixibacteraceae bacterium]|nr:hypothetical protein [Prolixibacteraceae bacterium]
MRHPKSHKKKPVKLSQKTKLVRINHRTQVEVPVAVPDDVAIERYYQRHTTAVRPPIVADVEELEEAIIDEDVLPEEE